MTYESSSAIPGIRVFAGAGPDVDLYDVDDDESGPTGNFAFSHSHDSYVNRVITPGDGEASATGINVTNDSVSLTPTQLSVVASRSASGSAHEISGTANATSGSSSFLEIFFHVLGSPANYTLNGSFVVDPDTNPTLLLTSTAGLGQEFNINSTSNPNLSGELLPGRWRFRLQMINSISPSGSGNSLSFGSSYDLTFNVASTVPEPGSLCLLLPVATFGWLMRSRAILRRSA